jgi:hypothetical protein
LWHFIVDFFSRVFSVFSCGFAIFFEKDRVAPHTKTTERVATASLLLANLASKQEHRVQVCFFFAICPV